MAGAGTLDVPAMADLAEARWRSGDLEGAAEAARAHQASGGAEPLAALILAEDLARVGRRPDALRVAEWTYQRVGGAVDVLFAGQPRSDAWPPADDAWMDRGATTAGRWGLLVGGSEVADPDPRTWPLMPRTDVPAGGPLGPSLPPPPASSGPGGVLPLPAATGRAAVVMTGRRAGEELEAADRSLAAGQVGEAAERLAVLLRLDPALAPVILSAADRAVASAPPGSGLTAIHLVRGDAYRLLGRENEAADAFQRAHRALATGPRPEDPT